MPGLQAPQPLLEFFIARIKTGQSVKLAHADMALYAFHAAGAALACGVSVEDIIAHLGIAKREAANSVADLISTAANKTRKPDANATARLKSGDFWPWRATGKWPIFHDFANNLYVVVDTGDINSIPTPDCLEKHLPKDRQPTEEEIRNAWAKCTKS